VSGLWTPSGGDPARDEPPTPFPADPDDAMPSGDELAAMRELHAQLVATPVVDVIANHAIGICQLALVHLGVMTPPDEQGRQPVPDLAAAGLAIDAMAAIVDGLGTRLGEHEEVLREALTQVQMVFVQIAEGPEGPEGATEG
jgi:hypothetical protein